MIIFDLDGVCAHSRWREPLIDSQGWDAFHARCDEDEPNLFVRDMVNAFTRWADADCLALTGRPESVRGRTERWLAEHGFMFSEVLMRPLGDFRRSPALKIALLEDRFGPRWAEQVSAVFDDREDILAEFAALHIQTYHVTLTRDNVLLKKGINQ